MEIKHREPARTLRELYNNLNPLEFLTKENRHFYVDVYGHIIAEIRKDLLWSDEPRQTIYITGQSGSGKTTALNFLPNVKAGLGFKFLDFINTGTDFFYNYRNSREQRDITRKVLTFKKHELRDLVNEVIERYLETIDSGNKRLLIVFNELDHIKDWPTIEELFLGGDRYLLEGLKCKKIISLPVILKIKPFKDKMIY